MTQKKLNEIFLKQGAAVPCFFFKKLGSTNDEAKNLIRSGVERGAVLAARQTKGRGRFGRVFLSKKGKGVYLSYFAPCALADVMPLGGLCALAVVRAVWDLYRIRCEIKWPNDVVFEGKKLSGILPESVGGAGECRAAVIGVGINVNYTSVDFGVLKKTAVSVRQLTKKRQCVFTLAAAAAKRLDEIFAALPQNKAALAAEYAARCGTLGKTVQFVKDGKAVTAKAVGTDADCALILDINGKAEKIAWGEISVKPADN